MNDHTSTIVTRIPVCDLDASHGPAAVDGKTVFGPWANMCAACHAAHGSASDWGAANVCSPPEPHTHRNRDTAMNESEAIPQKSLHRFYLDVWALDAGDAWAYFRDLVRDGLDAVESHGVARVDAAAPWELDALRARLAGMESDLAHLTHVDDDDVDVDHGPEPHCDDCDPARQDRWSLEYDDDGAVVGPHPVDDCPPHGVSRVYDNGVI